MIRKNPISVEMNPYHWNMLAIFADDLVSSFNETGLRGAEIKLLYQIFDEIKLQLENYDRHGNKKDDIVMRKSRKIIDFREIARRGRETKRLSENGEHFS